MPGPSLKKNPWKLRAKERLSSILHVNRPPSPQSVLGSPQSTSSQMSRPPLVIPLAPPPTTANDPPNTPLVPTSQTATTQLLPVTAPTTSNVPLGTSNPFLVIGGLSVTPPSPPTHSQKAKEAASTAYAGLTQVIQGLYDCSDMFPPLKAAAGVFLTISKAFGAVSDNKAELKELEVKLGSILSIIQKYKDHHGIPALKHRIETFCEALVLQKDAVEELRNHSVWARTPESIKDADKIVKAFRTMSILCDVFQMDTQLNTNVIVEDILQRLRSNVIDKLNHESTSYKTRHSSYGDPSGCMEGTRVKILADLEGWASSDDSHKVYWMVGMAGTGKSTISQTFCEILDGKNMLAASFFCSRVSEKTSNPRYIIPTIAYELAKTSPSIKSEIVMAIDEDEKLAEANFLNLEDQFKKLVYQPIRASIGQAFKTYKVVVIDAVDECVDTPLAASLIRLILKFVPGIPLKIFIASRDETPIRKAFQSGSGIQKNFYLHDVEKDVVENDIQKYLETSLAKIKEYDGGDTSEEWPSQSELSALLDRAGTLFIYAATAIRYIADGDELYQDRLSEMAIRGPEMGSGFQIGIDGLYGHVLEKACTGKPPQEVGIMRELISIIVFLRSPLQVEAIESLSQMKAGRLSAHVSRLTSVIHVSKESVVTPFHASFPDFITNPTRCSPERFPGFKALVATDGHTILALRCLEHMNGFLRYNICDVATELTVSRRGIINSPDNINRIPEALKYSCLQWASHLAEVQEFSTELITALHKFLHEHLLHWIECVSALDELQRALKSLGSAGAALSRFITVDTRWNGIRSLVEDARRWVQRNFEGVQKNCFEVYHSALVWIPRDSPIRKVYSKDVRCVPKVILGLSSGWGSTELVMQNGSPVNSIALSPDGSRVVSGSDDKTVRIWNTTTGEVEAELKGHTHWVVSVVFSPDGSRVVSGSHDRTARIWNTTTGEVAAELKGHTGSVSSIAFSPDGNQVVSGSEDGTVRTWNTATSKVAAELKGHAGSVRSVGFSPDGGRAISGSKYNMGWIWNVTTGEVEVELHGHMGTVTSVAFSQDGSRVVSGSYDKMVRVWNATTGEVQAELDGHGDEVNSVAFSSDGSRIVSGSDDKAVRIWNATTGKIATVLKGHTNRVVSVAFFPDGGRVVSGSYDGTVRILNATTGGVQDELNGHSDEVNSVAFSSDGSRVVSGSDDNTVRIWGATTGLVEAKLTGHTDRVRSVAFSPDGSRLVSGSDDTAVRIWNTMTGSVEADLMGHTGSVLSVAFFHDGRRVASGSSDETVRIWNTVTGEVEAELKGHTDWVRSVAISPDGTRVVSGSDDRTVRIWNTTTGELTAELTGHTYWVMSVAFSLDGSQVISGSDDKTVRIWNATTGESQLMTTPSTTLPDSSEIHQWYAGSDKFHVIYPVQQPTLVTHQPLYISEDGQWILGRLHDCWIPPHDRDIKSTSFSHGRICLGYKSGRVVILDMNIAS